MSDDSYEVLKKALMEFFGDTTQSVEECRDGLRAIIDEAEILLETLK